MLKYWCYHILRSIFFFFFFFLISKLTYSKSHESFWLLNFLSHWLFENVNFHGFPCCSSFIISIGLSFWALRNLFTLIKETFWWNQDTNIQASQNITVSCKKWNELTFTSVNIPPCPMGQCFRSYFLNYKLFFYKIIICNFKKISLTLWHTFSKSTKRTWCCT